VLVGTDEQRGAAMWLALLLFSSASGLVLWLARLKVFALIPATMIFALFAVSGGIALKLHWGTIAFTVIASATILQASYLIAGLLSEAPSPRLAPCITLRPDLVRAAQIAIGEELRIHFRTSNNLPRQVRSRVEQLAVLYG
jgi:hypothetical protein